MVKKRKSLPAKPKGTKLLKRSEMLIEICDRVANGKTLSNVLKGSKPISLFWFYQLMRQGQQLELSQESGEEIITSLHEYYQISREIRSHVLLDRLEDTTNIRLSGDSAQDQGRLGLARHKAQVLQWILSRLNPKDYGSDIMPATVASLNINISLTPQKPGRQGSTIDQ